MSSTTYLRAASRSSDPVGRRGGSAGGLHPDVTAATAARAVNVIRPTRGTPALCHDGTGIGTTRSATAQEQTPEPLVRHAIWVTLGAFEKTPMLDLPDPGLYRTTQPMPGHENDFPSGVLVFVGQPNNGGV